MTMFNLILSGLWITHWIVTTVFFVMAIRAPVIEDEREHRGAAGVYFGVLTAYAVLVPIFLFAPMETWFQGGVGPVIFMVIIVHLVLLVIDWLFYCQARPRKWRRIWL